MSKFAKVDIQTRLSWDIVHHCLKFLSPKDRSCSVRTNKRFVVLFGKDYTNRKAFPDICGEIECGMIHFLDTRKIREMTTLLILRDTGFYLPVVITLTFVGNPGAAVVFISLCAKAYVHGYEVARYIRPPKAHGEPHIRWTGNSRLHFKALAKLHAGQRPEGRIGMYLTLVHNMK